MPETTALFLCAGAGTRATEVARNLPKCLLEIDGIPLIDRARSQLARIGVRTVSVIGGFEWDQLAEALDGSVLFRVWDGWRNANNLWTLGANVDLLTGGGCRVILFGDVAFDQRIVEDLLASTADVALVVDTTSRLSGTMRVRRRGDRFEIGNEVPPEDSDGNFIGILKLSQLACQLISAELSTRFTEGRGRHDYYTAVLPQIAGELSVEFIPVGNNRWAEVDTPEDYARARSIFERSHDEETLCVE